ncbi:MAG: Ig-like domain-containing protein, partial [Myxococcota bacterium]
EGAAVRFELPDSTLYSIWRNVAGLNDVDLSPAFDLRAGFGSGGRAPYGWVANNIVGFAGGSGIELFRTWPDIVNNTIAFSGRGDLSTHGVADSTDGIAAVTYDPITRETTLGEAAPSSPAYVTNTISFGNSGRDLEMPVNTTDTVSQIRGSYCLAGDPVSGWNNLQGDPIFTESEGPSDLLEYLQVAPASPSTNAGDPSARFNNPDGTRNHIGAFGGPGASPILGPLGTSAPIPFVVMGVRPFVHLAAGVALSNGQEDYRVVFSDDVDPMSVDSTSVRFATVGGGDVAGTYTVQNNTVTFSPSAALTPGSVVQVTVSGVTSSAGPSQVFAFGDVFGILLASATAEVEDNDNIANAQVISGSTFAFSGGTNPSGGDTIDHYSITALEGQRLSATVFSTRISQDTSIADYSLRLLDPSGVTVFEASDQFGFAADLNPPSSPPPFFQAVANDPYLDYVFDTAGTYTL